ncbi:MAG: hypothetical protein A2096_07560 [Spirochaetes bacterium GWF1_41_5]|nr:MAG: hypothetical protein A2096_07560 [Spirochaetes bacterium GWF1_41_5]
MKPVQKYSDKEYGMINKPQVIVIGGGMITEVQILPSLYQLKRIGVISDISVCALNGEPLKRLAESESIKTAFPGFSFRSFPDFTREPLDKPFPDLYKEVLDQADPGSIAFIALPDQLHYNAIKEALGRNLHVITVKPLVLKYKEAREIEELAFKKGLFTGIEYHKRSDDRALMARRHYRSGDFGEFMLGQATMVEPWYYRNSNFQNWCTKENSDMFSYVGCHYIDQVHFITGLLPVEISVYGIINKYPNGKEGYLYTDGRVIWNNGACLNVQNAMGYPDIAPGGNTQGLQMLCRGEKDAGYLFHQDQYRGIKYSLLKKGTQPGDTYYNEPSPDYFKYVEYGGDGLEPVGYGYRSIQKLLNCVNEVNARSDLDGRREIIQKIDQAGILATPANSYYNELVMEAGRLSITNSGKPAVITYGKEPSVKLK